MTNPAFDTLTAANELQEAGFDRRQAEALTRTMAKVQGDLATKSDIDLLKQEIRSLRVIMFTVLLPVQLTTLILVLAPHLP